MQEIYDSRLVAGKLRRWSHYLQHYRLPTWEQIPTLGLYMDQQLCPHEADACAGEEKV